MKRSKRFRIEKWCWRIQIPVALFLYLFVGHVWIKLATVYIAFLSLYALDLTASEAEASAEAVENTEKK